MEWLVTLLIAVLFGVWLTEKKVTVTAWILAAIATLILSWIFTVFLATLVPTLGLTAQVDLTAYITATISGLALGFATVKVKNAIITA